MKLIGLWAGVASATGNASYCLSLVYIAVY